MTKRSFPFAILFVFLMYSASWAVGLEMAVGGWRQSPSGDLSYKGEESDDTLNLEDNLGYDSENRFMGRLKIDLPLLLPNIYVMAVPMEFEGTGNKSTQFTFGDETFDANADIYSKVTINQCDIALYTEIPFLRMISADVLNVDLGINARFIDFSVEVTGKSAMVSGETIHDEESLSIVIPMAYVGVQISPTDQLAIEAEARCIFFGGNSLCSFIGRVRMHAFGPVFIAGGYRIDGVDVDVDDIKVDMDLSGPFVEMGFKF